jgi:hypothetical protein
MALLTVPNAIRISVCSPSFGHVSQFANRRVQTAYSLKANEATVLRGCYSIGEKLPATIVPIVVYMPNRISIQHMLTNKTHLIPWGIERPIF